jgi:hypothetical protein
MKDIERPGILLRHQAAAAPCLRTPTRFPNYQITELFSTRTYCTQYYRINRFLHIVFCLSMILLPFTIMSSANTSIVWHLLLSPLVAVSKSCPEDTVFLYYGQKCKTNDYGKSNGN